MFGGFQCTESWVFYGRKHIVWDYLNLLLCIVFESYQDNMFQSAPGGSVHKIIQWMWKLLKNSSIAIFVFQHSIFCEWKLSFTSGRFVLCVILLLIVLRTKPYFAKWCCFVVYQIVYLRQRGRKGWREQKTGRLKATRYFSQLLRQDFCTEI